MIKVEKIDVWGFEHAIRGMRNPLNSWSLSDSRQGCRGNIDKTCIDCGFDPNWCGMRPTYIVGEKDLELMKKLYWSGPEHRKYLRQIFVSMDITAPLYWWKEMDTYKVGTTADSCSTMHKITEKEFELDDFSIEHLSGEIICDVFQVKSPFDVLYSILDMLNICRRKYIETKDKKYWWQIIQMLPSSYNQKRTFTMTYENVVSMIKQRETHKLDEWREFVKVLNDLPYISEITATEEGVE